MFSPLAGLDIARVGALEIERMIGGYGLKVAPGGIDPQVLLDLMDRQQNIGANASSRDLTRTIEESIADSLIVTKQKGATEIVLVRRADGIVAEVRSSSQLEASQA